MSDAEGYVVVRRYRLQRRIGDGGMGAVWLAQDERLGRSVALKRLTLPPGTSADDAEQARQRVFREARAAARLQHPHAVAVFDVVEDGGVPVLVMEYVPSRSLAEILAERGRLAPVEAARIGAQVASALAAAHAASIVHRDVKPGNILLADDGTAKITDFGIARIRGDVVLTQTGLLAGTPAYLSPEAARGEQPAPPSDVFSLGATLYAAVEGAPPFGQSDNAIAMVHTVAAGHARPAQRAGPLTEPLMAMLRDDPAARPTMAAVQQRLEAISTGADPDGPTEFMAPVAPRPPATRLDLQPVPAQTSYAVAAAPAPAPDQDQVRRRNHVLLGTLAAGLLLLLLITLLTLPDRPGTATGATGPSPRASAGPTAPDPALLQQAVAEFYALLPDDTETAWTRLGPDLRAQGERQFDRAWRDVKDLAVVAPPQASGTTVVIEIEYTSESRGRVRERHQLGLVVQDGRPLINSDQVLSTTVIKGGDGKDKGKKGDGDGEGAN